MRIKGNITQYEDLKYVMMDTGSLYLGAKYSYEELLEAEMLPFKMKAILTQYILKETSPENTLESEFYYLKQGTFLYDTLYQLKARAKVQIQVEKKNLFGKKKIEYQEKILTLRELTEMNLAQKKASGLVINEIIISKLAMMAFAI